MIRAWRRSLERQIGSKFSISRMLVIDEGKLVFDEFCFTSENLTLLLIVAQQSFKRIAAFLIGKVVRGVGRSRIIGGFFVTRDVTRF